MKYYNVSVITAGVIAIGIAVVACESQANSSNTSFHSDVVDTLNIAYGAEEEIRWRPNIRVIRDEKRKTTCYYSHNGFSNSSPALFCLRDEK